MENTKKVPLREKIADISNRKFTFRGEKYHVGETLASYTLLTPTIITLIILFILPLIMLIVLSFTDYRVTTGQMKFNGIDNYIYLFTSDKFWKAMSNTVFFAVVKLGLDVILALAVALALDSNIWCRKVLRTIYFSPVVTPVVACSLIWLWFYDPGIGPFNQILGWFGIEPLKWIYSENTAMLSIIIFSVWHGLGYNVMLLLSGLQGIHRHLGMKIMRGADMNHINICLLQHLFIIRIKGFAAPLPLKKRKRLSKQPLPLFNA